MKPNTLQINPKYQGLVYPLTSEDYQTLKASIKASGQYVPIVINPQGILDGHHRYKACRELSLEPVTAIKSFPNEPQEQLFVIDSNLKRRHLNSFQRVWLALKFKPILLEIAKLLKTKKLSAAYWLCAG
jgi:hypothetical protein